MHYMYIFYIAVKLFLCRLVSEKSIKEVIEDAIQKGNLTKSKCYLKFYKCLHTRNHTQIYC